MKNLHCILEQLENPFLFRVTFYDKSVKWSLYEWWRAAHWNVMHVLCKVQRDSSCTTYLLVWVSRQSNLSFTLKGCANIPLILQHRHLVAWVVLWIFISDRTQYNEGPCILIMRQRRSVGTVPSKVFLTLNEGTLLSLSWEYKLSFSQVLFIEINHLQNHW